MFSLTQKTANKITQTKTGFVLLYALLVASVVLIVGLTLSNIILKQLIISSISREMNQAYYVANAGRECLAMMQAAEAKANEIKSQDDTISLSGKISCADIDGAGPRGTTIVDDSPSYDWGDLKDNINQFNVVTSPGVVANNQLTYNYIADPATSLTKKVCALIDLQSIKDKAALNDDQFVNNFHVIWSRGYNTECPGPTNLNTARQVERIICQDFDVGDSTDSDGNSGNGNDGICAAER